MICKKTSDIVVSPGPGDVCVCCEFACESIEECLLAAITNREQSEVRPVPRCKRLCC